MTTQPLTLPAFRPAQRLNHSLTAATEKRILLWLAARAPSWVTSDGLTLLGLAAQLAAGLAYALARYNRLALVAVILALALNWLGDSLDGTLARVRHQERPRYGFYVDHIVDIFGAVALMLGLGFSTLVHWQVALAMLLAFLVLSAESYLATYTLGRFQLSQGIFGPTELRILLAIGNLALLHSPWVTFAGHRILLFDLGGTIGTIGMALMAITTACKHTAQLFHQEPLQ